MVKLFYFIMCFMCTGFLGMEMYPHPNDGDYPAEYYVTRTKREKLARFTFARRELTERPLIDQNGRLISEEKAIQIRQRIGNSKISSDGECVLPRKAGLCPGFDFVVLEGSIAAVYDISFSGEEEYRVTSKLWGYNNEELMRVFLEDREGRIYHFGGLYNMIWKLNGPGKSERRIRRHYDYVMKLQKVGGKYTLKVEDHDSKTSAGDGLYVSTGTASSSVVTESDPAVDSLHVSDLDLEMGVLDLHPLS